MMEDFEREVTVFNTARRLPAEARRTYLEETCAGDDALRRRVEELLRSTEEAEGFLEDPAPGAQRPADAVPQPGSLLNALVTGEKPGDRIGRYKLLQQIGAGGCGVVYMAEQEEPVRRRVALKVIKLGMDTKGVIARFEAERQALALMEHPNIAKVLDAGSTEAGRPFFVMELVRGIKITEYCDQNNVSMAERLGLFIQVCQAIQHAHQKGIIHRDIKPSNILVTVNDGVAVPKVIDFGIAKATQGRLTAQTLFTAFEQFIGTPAYMSPEQAVMTSLDIDTRSDTYSLGVLLYELLTGRTPFDVRELLASGFEEMRRTIREQEPPRPSARLSTLQANELTTTAKRRQSEPLKLIHQIRGDLDWIVMKCLEKDRTRRYETANGLAMDVQRYLADEPVIARPPSNLYRFRKLVRRNKLTFAAVGSVVAALLFGLGISTCLLVKERTARRRAVAAENKSDQLAKFFKSMLQGVRPSRALGRDTTVLREILDRTAERVGKELTNQPEVEVEVQLTLATTYDELGLYQQMETMARQSLNLARAKLGPENVSVANSLGSLGDAYMHLGKLPDAEKYNREALAMRRKLFASEHNDVAMSLNNLALVLEDQGRLAEAESMQREALAMKRKLLGAEHLDIAASLGNLATVLQKQDRLDEAETLQREGLEMEKKLAGGEHPLVATSLANLADLLRRQGKEVEAENMQREALKIRKKLLGQEHPDIASSLGSLAVVLESQGRWAEAETLQQEALEMERKLLGNEHLSVAGLLNNLANVLMGERKLAEAESAQREALAIQRKLLGEEHPDVAGSLHNLARMAIERGRIDEGAALHREALTMSMKLLGKENSTVADSLSDLIHVLVRKGELNDAQEAVTNVLAEAETMQPEPLAKYRQFLDDDSRGGFSWLVYLSGALQDQGEVARAEDVSRVVLAMRRRMLGNQNVQVANSLTNLSNVLEQQGRLAEAEKAEREALTIRLNLSINQLAAVMDSIRHLVDLLMLQHKFEEAEKLFNDLLPQVTASPAHTAVLLGGRAHFLARRGRFKEAITDLEKAKELLPNEHLVYAMLAPLLVVNGDHEAYRGLCDQILEHFGGTNNPVSLDRIVQAVIQKQSWWAIPVSRETMAQTAIDAQSWRADPAVGETGNVPERMAKDCLILPSSGTDLKTVSEMVTTALMVGAHSDDVEWFQFAKGLAEYRQGHYASALEWMRKVQSAQRHDSHREVELLAVMAMTQYQLQQAAPAGAALAKGSRLAEANLAKLDAGDLRDDWEDWIIAHALLDEAKALIPESVVPSLIEVPIAEIDFEDKQPSEGYWAGRWSELPAALPTTVRELAAAGAGGKTGLLMTVDGSTLPPTGWAGFGVNVEVAADSTTGIDTTNQDLYKLYATVRTTGITGPRSHGWVEWWYFTPGGVLLNMQSEVTFTTNFQTYSFVLGDGQICPFDGGPWARFVAEFDKVNKIGFRAKVDEWRRDYGTHADNNLYVSDVKFVRLVPRTQLAPSSANPPGADEALATELARKWKNRQEAAWRRSSGGDKAWHGHLAEAVADFSRAIELNPEEHESWHWQAAALVQLGQIDACRELCRKSLQRFGNTTDPITAERIAKDFLILPCSSSELETAAKLAQTAVCASTNPAVSWFRLAKGLAEYRQNHFASALEWAKQVMADKGPNPNRDTEACVLLAMAQYRLDQIDEARAALTEGLQIADIELQRFKDGEFDSNWVDWIFARALLAEAKALLQCQPSTPEEEAAAWKQRQRAIQAAEEASVRRASGLVHAQHGRFAEAAADFAKVLELHPPDFDVWHWQAVTLLQLGRIEAYRELRRQGLKRFKDTTNPFAADHIAKAYLTMPGSGPELELAAKLAQVAVSAPADHPTLRWFWLVKGLGEYRQGHYDAAVQWMEKVLAAAGEEPGRDAAAWMVMAMARQQLRQSDQARQLLDRGLEIMNSRMPKLDGGYLGDAWLDCITANLLSQEAKALIRAPSSTARN